MGTMIPVSGSALGLRRDPISGAQGTPSRSPISQPSAQRERCSSRRLSPVGGRAVLAAWEAVHPGERCCGGRRSSGTGADRAKLLAGVCLQGGCSTAASINLWGTSASATQA